MSGVGGGNERTMTKLRFLDLQIQSPKGGHSIFVRGAIIEPCVEVTPHGPTPTGLLFLSLLKTQLNPSHLVSFASALIPAAAKQRVPKERHLVYY